MIEVDTEKLSQACVLRSLLLIPVTRKVEKIIQSYSEKIIGIIDPYSCRVSMAIDKSDNYPGRLSNHDSIELILVQSGEHPVVISNHDKNN